MRNLVPSLAKTAITALALTAFGGTDAAFAQTLDPSLEVFRIRCQIDLDIDPVTGLEVPKVQIQIKARADLLDGLQVGIMVENITAVIPPLPSVVDTVLMQRPISLVRCGSITHLQ